MPQGDLAHVLRGLQSRVDQRLLVGPQTFDDAGVFELGDGGNLPGAVAGKRVALVQTVDFFPPVVDDAYAYGAIAAANALSDVYAMGGKPITALTLAAFPKEFPREWIEEIFRGGFDKLAEAGAVVAGGHTVESEIQFGFSVTGLVDPTRMTTNAGAKLGDVVYLTKPIGMGTLTTAGKLQKISWEALQPAVKQMSTLNAAACDAMLAAHAHAATDITGYGLMGHARNVAKASGLTLELELAKVPIFPGVLELAAKGVFSGGTKRGRMALKEEVRLTVGLDPVAVAVTFDAETSGGLLIAVAEEDAPTLERELALRNLPVARIGRFKPKSGVHVELV
ncbi:MAG: selenide, water dikinase SelD [Planctomycetes bacterium]|nr:selenide, water dikinase SelD [Planctomycetota bacterium]